MSMEAMYQEVILDHYRHPHGSGLVEPFDAQVHHVNPTCGDEVTLRVRLAGDPQRPVVDSVSFAGEGCSISQASASVLHDQVSGQSLTTAFDMVDAFTALMHSATNKGAEPDEELLGDAIAFQGVARYPARIKCALLAWMAFKDAASQATAARANGAQAWSP
ncbi:MAG: SUF system NifU family Fe-S cluster assembly protein [Actinomycetes bacterium]